MGKRVGCADTAPLTTNEYSVVVKVIDILGNDTTKALQLKVTGGA